MAPNANHDARYSTARWQRRRARQLQEFPLCATCLAEGIPEPATVADHVTPHQGDSNEFWFGELQSLCASCHSGTKRRAERQVAAGIAPYSNEVGVDGWPVDPHHPANLPRNARGGSKGGK